MSKEQRDIEQIYWNAGTTFVSIIPSWKHYGRYDYIHEQIIALRMRPEWLKENPIFIVMRDNNDKVKVA